MVNDCLSLLYSLMDTTVTRDTRVSVATVVTPRGSLDGDSILLINNHYQTREGFEICR